MQLGNMKSALKSLIVRILIFEAKVLLRRKRPKIIAITGSVGKTSTKDAIYAVLKKEVYIRKSQKSFNSELGVPLSVLGLNNAWSNPFLWLKNIIDGAIIAFFSREYPDVLVLEVGVDRPGDMCGITQWILPDVVVLTRLPDVPVHVEYFASPQEVIEEKMELVHALKDDGLLVYNNDDAMIRELVTKLPHQSFGYGTNKQSHFIVSETEIVCDNGKPTGMRALLTHVDQSVPIQLHGVLGTHQLYTCAAAAAVAQHFGMTLQDIARALETYTPPPGRMRLLEGIHDTVIIDDTYNSSPAAAEKALEVLQNVPCAGRRVAVLGDMLELGQYSVREHERIGEIAAQKVQMLVTLGVRSQKTAEAAIAHGMSEKQVLQCENTSQVIEFLTKQVRAGDTVLIKASQGMRAERVVKALLKDPAADSQLLVRQSHTWLHKK